jgi:hypothetical protein
LFFSAVSAFENETTERKHSDSSSRRDFAPVLAPALLLLEIERRLGARRSVNLTLSPSHTQPPYHHSSLFLSLSEPNPHLPHPLFRLSLSNENTQNSRQENKKKEERNKKKREKEREREREKEKEKRTILIKFKREEKTE